RSLRSTSNRKGGRFVLAWRRTRRTPSSKRSISWLNSRGGTRQPSTTTKRQVSGRATCSHKNEHENRAQSAVSLREWKEIQELLPRSGRSSNLGRGHREGTRIFRARKRDEKAKLEQAGTHINFWAARGVIHCLIRPHSIPLGSWTE